MQRVLVLDHAWPDLDVEQAVLKAADIETVAAETRDEKALIELVADFDALMVNWLPLPAAVIDAAVRCRTIARFGVGVDNIDVGAATRNGILVSRVPVFCTDEVAEHALALILALARHITAFAEQTRTGGWSNTAAGPMYRIRGSVLGLVGWGATAQALASRARGIGMRVLVHSRSISETALPEGVEAVPSLVDLAGSVDFLSVHVPLSEHTRGLIDASVIAAMRPTAYLINTARGPIVDTDALAHAVRHGRIAGAGIDVLDADPPTPGNPLLDLPNVVVTHLRDWKSELMDGGSARSADTAARLGEILAVLHGSTFGDQTVAAGFGDTDSFVELRIDPFHRTVARRIPDATAQLDELADELISHPQCLVHGDYSPKNILASGSEAWVIDWEVAHFGNPVFDLAFMLAHLLCKTVHAPTRHDLYRGCAQSFVAAYIRNAPTALQPDPDRLARHTAAVVLARTDGKSPVGYLQPPQRESARRLARDVLSTSSVIDDVVQHLWRGFR